MVLEKSRKIILFKLSDKYSQQISAASQENRKTLYCFFDPLIWWRHIRVCVDDFFSNLDRRTRQLENIY